MKKYHRKNYNGNVWILGLPPGAPPQAALSLLPKGTKIKITFSGHNTEENKPAEYDFEAMHEMALSMQQWRIGKPPRGSV